MVHDLRIACLGVATAGTLGIYSLSALALCSPPRQALADGTAIADKQVQLAWTPVEGATAYRVRLQSRVPNGRVVASHDTVVTTPSFRPPQPLAEHRAKVTVRLNAVCGAETSAESVSWFLIDTSVGCNIGELNAKAAGGKARLRSEERRVGKEWRAGGTT